MIGTFRWNLVSGMIGFIGTLFVSLPNNIMKTAFIQSCYSFAFLFFFAFVIRWVLGILIHSSGVGPQVPHQQSDQDNLQRGQSIDLATPNEDSLSIDSVEDSLFAPLNPPKLSTKLDQDPEELVKALRRMTDE